MPKAKTISRMTLIVFAFLFCYGWAAPAASLRKLQMLRKLKRVRSSGETSARRGRPADFSLNSCEAMLTGVHSPNCVRPPAKPSLTGGQPQDAKQGSRGFRFDKKGRRNANVPLCLTYFLNGYNQRYVPRSAC